ncbi:hypothetical protein LWP59_17485 [Amycolatopsis acidiphila]|uniref:DUF2231 domain-containing protein n=1 Tax=Amycolatopsis acidiphila TaxID=715473 RepID=A0A558ANZ9_9PSEU|nr:DUF2231 domain-containing protein [Amycolatopsis acidiphila]TVT25986.1 hypothetical protein FNH06_00730 [Amycolatopsis acidiphila]UIJ63299.1 hypothetical protein LWP59_17485 [Amycolatopsis acidiphila]GHG74878.1 hypothetical protein GCM10017788_39200 [Amycolatopsis acidiphila]
MPVFISGLPLHVLVVHAVVVLVPLSVLAALTVTVWPAARRRYGWVAVGVTAAATACIPIATSSGEDLRDRLVPTALIRQHAHLGDQLLIFVAALLVVLTALVWFARRPPREAPGAARRPMRALVPVLMVLTIGLAAVSVVQVVRIGDSGARAAWSGVQYTAPQHQGGAG